MKADNEKLSALIDNEIIDEQLLDELIRNDQQQAQFSRYHLIGDAMRSGADEPLIDVTQGVMAAIKQHPSPVTTVDDSKHKGRQQENHNVVSFVKRFGQYAIAASVAGVVVVASLVTSSPGVENNDAGIEVLNTVPFGGATPVSLETMSKQSQETVEQRNQRLEALLKDHQLQLQIQP